MQTCCEDLPLDLFFTAEHPQRKSGMQIRPFISVLAIVCLAMAVPLKEDWEEELNRRTTAVVREGCSLLRKSLRRVFRKGQSVDPEGTAQLDGVIYIMLGLQPGQPEQPTHPLALRKACQFGDVTTAAEWNAIYYPEYLPTPSGGDFPDMYKKFQRQWPILRRAVEHLNSLESATPEENAYASAIIRFLDTYEGLGLLILN